MKLNVQVQGRGRVPLSPPLSDPFPHIMSFHPGLRQPFWARNKDGHRNFQSYAKEGSSQSEMDNNAPRTRISLLWLVVYYTTLSTWGVLVLGYLFVFADYLYHGFTR